MELEHNCVTGVKKDEMIWTVGGEESAARADKPHRRLVVGGRDGGAGRSRRGVVGDEGCTRLTFGGGGVISDCSPGRSGCSFRSEYRSNLPRPPGAEGVIRRRSGRCRRRASAACAAPSPRRRSRQARPADPEGFRAGDRRRCTPRQRSRGSAVRTISAARQPRRDSVVESSGDTGPVSKILLVGCSPIHRIENVSRSHDNGQKWNFHSFLLFSSMHHRNLTRSAAWRNISS